MPNNSYLRSRKREQELVRALRRAGWIACRSAGSKSPFDVWAFHPTGEGHRKPGPKVWLIQIKTKRGSKYTLYKDEKRYENVIVSTWTEQAV